MSEMKKFKIRDAVAPSTIVACGECGTVKWREKVRLADPGSNANQRKFEKMARSRIAPIWCHVCLSVTPFYEIDGSEMSVVMLEEEDLDPQDECIANLELAAKAISDTLDWYKNCNSQIVNPMARRRFESLGLLNLLHFLNEKVELREGSGS